MRFHRASNLLLAVVAVVWFSIVFNTNKWKENEIIRGDVLNYYSYLPALIIDGDFTFSFRKRVEAQESNQQILGSIMPDEKYVPKMSMGMAILYAPFFLVGHLLAGITGIPTDGFSLPYVLMMLIGHCFYFIIGLYYLRKVLRHQFTAKATFYTLLCLLICTNLFYYGFMDIGMSHAYSFCLFSIFLWLTIQWTKLPNKSNSIKLGVLFGLIVLVRPTNIILALVFVFYNVYNKVTLLNSINTLISQWKNCLLIPLLAFAVFSLQMMFWKYTSGSWFFFSYGEEGFFFTNPKIMEGLFSYRKGWLLYTPVMSLALLGIFFGWKLFKKWALSVALFSLLNIYIVFSWWCWWYGASFGSRAMVESYAILAIPLAGIIDSKLLKHKLTRALLYLILLVTGGLNILQTIQYHHFLHYDSMTKEAYHEIFLARNNFEWPMGFEKKLKKPDYENALLGLNEDLEKVAKNNEVAEQISRIKQNIDWLNEIKEQAVKKGISLDTALARNARFVLYGRTKSDNAISIELSPLEVQIEKIKRSAKWFKQVKQQAKERGISVDSALVKNAQYMLRKTSELKQQIERIKADSLWLNQVQEQAIKKGVSLDTALARNAQYMINKKKENGI